ncbi:MAG: 1-(5-phosphoribosyl)-5-[(5-phosphoribosylamino)methylideneamino]imidazole-4-carboxamide isomerase [Candidatus Coproplasma sp.]
MLIFPAIDIIDGKVVRLTQGDYGKVKNYEITPMQAAQSFKEQGASCMHVVDLDGAKSGKADNAKTIESIVKNYDMFVEVGGGIRSSEQIERYLDCGVKRVILGTAAIKDFDFVCKSVEKFGGAISVGVDALNGKVAVNGWKEVTGIDSVDFCRKLEKAGVEHIIYTDISRDGGLKGTNLDIYKVLCQTLLLKITASGGITYLNELAELKKMGVYGAILGKALYEEKLDLKQAINLAEVD